MAIRVIQGFLTAALLFCAAPIFAQPDNDHFRNAQTLTGEPVTTAFLGGATLEPGEPDHGQTQLFPSDVEINESVWFSWTSPSSGILDAYLGNAFPFPVMALYRGTAVDQLTPVAATYRPSGAAFPVEANVLYKLALGRATPPGFEWTQEVPFSLQVKAMPTNDAFASAISINDQWSYDYFLTPGTLESGEPPQHTSGSHWWRWKAEASGTASFVTGAARPSGKWTVFEGETLSTLRFIKSIPGTNWYSSGLLFPARSNVTYHIAYSGLAEPLGSAMLYASLAPLSLTSSVQTAEYGGNLPLIFDILPKNPPTNAVLRLEMRNALGGIDSRTWTPPFPPGFVVTNVPAGTNQYQLVYTETRPPTFPPLPPVPGLPSVVGSSLAGPVQQYPSFASEMLTFVVRHPNDAFADAKTLVGTNLQFAVDFYGSSWESNEPPSLVIDSQIRGSVWCRWVAPHDGALRLSRFEMRFHDMSLDLYTGNSLTNLQLVTGRWESSPFNEYYVYRVQQGTEFFIRVYSMWYLEHTLELRLDPFPVNDDFADAIELPAAPLAVDLSAATLEESELNGPGTVWYIITPEVDGILECSVRNAIGDVQIYTGATLASAVEVSSRVDAVSVLLNAGITYHIQVGGLRPETGTPWFHNSFTPIPSNDHFANRTPLPVPSQTRVSLRAATIETNEVADWWIDASVWYSFTPAQSGIYSLEVNSFAIGNALSVYQGASLGSLQAVAPLAPNSSIYELFAGSNYVVRIASSRNVDVELRTRFYGTSAPGDHFAQPLTSPATFPSFLATESPDDPEVTLPSGISTKLKNTVWYVWTAPARGRFSLFAASASGLWIAAYTNAPSAELIPVTLRRTFMDLAVEQGQEYRFLLGYDGAPVNGPEIVWIEESFNSFELISPAAGSVFTMGQPITFRMSDPLPGIDPEIQSVSFFGIRWNQQYFFGTVTNAPFELTLSNVVFGVYEVRASAYSATDSYSLKPVAISVRTLPFENDNFADAAPISGRIFQQTLSTNAFLNCSIEPNEPGPTNVMFPGSLRGTLWYRWTAPASGTVRASSAPYWGTEGVFWKGSALTNLVAAAMTNGTTIVEKGQEYFIQLYVGGILSLRWTLELQTVRPAHNEWRTFAAGDPIDIALHVTELPEDVANISLYWNELLATTMTAPPWTSVVTHLPPGPMAPLYSVLTTRSGELVTNFAGSMRIYPANQSPERATVLASENLTIDFSSFDRTSYGEPFPGPTLFYRYTPQTNQFLTLRTARLAVTNFATGLAAESVPAPHWHPAPVFKLAANIEYLLAVDQPRTTNVALEFPTRPTNDNFADAEPLSLGEEGNRALWPVLATREAGETIPNFPNGSVWYIWNATDDGLLSLSTTDGAVYTGTSIGSLTPVAAIAAGSPLFPVTKGATYRIAIYSYGYAEHEFAASLIPGPFAEDRFADATLLSPGAGIVTARYLFSSFEPSEPPPADSPAFGSVWWKWVAPTNGQLWISQSQWPPPKLEVYAGATLNALVRQVPTSDYQNRRYTVFAGGTYYVRIERPFEAQRGDEVSFAYKFYSQPPNDHATSARVLSGSSIALSDTHIFATRDFGEPLHAGAYGGRSVWYRWRAEQRGALRISTKHQPVTFSEGLPLLAVYEGPTLGDVVVARKGQLLTNEVQLEVEAGDEFLIAVDYQGPFAEFTLDLEFLPIPFALQLLNRTNGIIQFSFESDRFVEVQTSTNLVDWTTISRYSPSAVKISTLPMTNGPVIFFRAVETP